MGEKRSFTVLAGHCLGAGRGDAVEGAVITIPEDLSPAEAVTKLRLGYIEEIPVEPEETQEPEETPEAEETPEPEETLQPEESLETEETPEAEETSETEETVEREGAAGTEAPASEETPGRVETGDQTPEHGDPASATPGKSRRRKPRPKK